MTYGICTDYNGKDKEKTMMETVSCAERQQRAGDGGSPVQVGGSASAPILAGAYSGALVPVGVLMALMGYVIGTGGGLIVANIMSMFG